MRADRLLGLVLRLQAHGKMKAQVLADELNVSRRTILRDIEALSLAGIPIYAEGGHGGGIALDENYRTSLTGLKEAEVHSLFISANSHHLRDVGLGEAAEHALLKLFAALPVKYQSSVDHIRQRIYVDPLWWWQDTTPLPYWAELQRAVYEDRRIEVLYEHYNGKITERTLEPYSLVAKASNWYLIAKREGEFRVYRVSRLQRVHVLSTAFRRDADFDLVARWAQLKQQFTENLADYAFTLRIHPSRANFAKWLTPGRWHIAETGEDGWLTMHFHVESQELAKMMVFGLGAQAVVEAPSELRDAVLEDARRVLDNYELPAT